MRGLRLPSLIPTRVLRAAGVRGEAKEDKRGAPKAASRSQTDAVGLAQFAMSFRRGRRDEVNPRRQIVMPVRDPMDEANMIRTFTGKGQFLVRQEQWDVLGRLIRETDANRETTSSGLSLAGLLARGARRDAVEAARATISQGLLPCGSIASGLDEAVEENPKCWGVALVAAQAHMDIGLAWRGNRPLTGRPNCDKPQFLYHFKRAADILDQYCAVEENSAVLAEARCDLLLGEPEAPSRVADDYEDLIDLDPANPRHMRRMGVHLLPRWFGSYELLDDLAHETAERTEDVWGDGGYSWVWMDVLRAVPEAAARLDVDRFVAGLHDILDANPSQNYANLLAAYCGVAMSPETTPDDISPAARDVRGEINDCMGWIVSDHLRELHPTPWAEAQHSPFATLPPVNELAERGELNARALISQQFHDAIAAGRTVTFSENGIEVQAPA
ncbi:hypothetical protein GLS40_13015 [Pseudooceanicola sp. 216_PA32_1]|uniref:Uncharacterized protein n=1 Tax=Pseudooceanicola pacificus TaxID=2676438 RepID=A0A844WC99_9RHOB|nr:hypothetical protein [Pseudooceanicola pacificus]MWB78953.1 hypothetical protein [Pseudooceanicola pacificus]